MTGRRPSLVLASLLLLGSTAAAGSAAEAARRPPLAVTVSTSARQVRFVAPSSVYQTRLEVFGPGEVKVFDSGLRFGNVLDWSFRNQQGEPLEEGSFACLVTVRDVSGQVAKRWGVLARGAGVAKWLAPSGADEAARELHLLAPPGEGDDPIGAARAGAGLATALLGHDGTAGLLASGSGGLSFRLGDYLAGEDVEMMRLSAEGNLGIGIGHPRAKLDVGGEIRTSEGIRFPDGTLQTTAVTQGAPVATAKAALTPVLDAVDGGGTPSLLAKWETSTALGNSTIAEVGGNIGIGTTSPGGAFDLQRASSGDILQRFWNTGTGGAKLRYVAADGATSQVQFTDVDEWLASIAVDETTGLQFRVRATSTSPNTEAGLAASPRMTIDRAGRVGIGTASPVAELHVAAGEGTNGGIIQVGGVGAEQKFIRFGGSAFIGLLDNTLKLTFGGASEFRFLAANLIPAGDNSTSLGTSTNRWSAVFAANGTIQTSDARLKKNVVDLPYGLQEVLRLRPVTYEWKDRPDGRHLGLIAQEVQRVLPETVVAGSDPTTPLGMSYAELVPVLVKAMQELQATVASQQDRILALETQIEVLVARRR